MPHTPEPQPRLISTDELARRLDLLLAVYGPGARDLPEYRLLVNMRARALR